MCRIVPFQQHVAITLGHMTCSYIFGVFPGYESKFYEESSLYGQTPAKILADVTPK